MDVGEQTHHILSSQRASSTFLALLEKLSTERAWYADAACRDADPHLFFPKPGGGNQYDVAAREICATCPVFDECAEVSKDELYGIWAGTSVEERRSQRRTP